VNTVFTLNAENVYRHGDEMKDFADAKNIRYDFTSLDTERLLKFQKYTSTHAHIHEHSSIHPYKNA
jgi:hypothetical protein